MSAVRQALAIARKDLQSELRTRYALNSLAMFTVVVVSVLTFSLGAERLSASATSGLIWVSMFFAAVTGLGRSFISEEERGTIFLLRLTVSSTPVYFGKLLVNTGLALFGNLIIGLLFLLLIPGVAVESFWLFIFFIGLSSLGFAAALTIIAAIIARSSGKSALYPVLGFPVLLPQIILGVDLLRRAISGKNISTMWDDILLIALYTGLLIVLSYILFDILWKE